MIVKTYMNIIKGENIMFRNEEDFFISELDNRVYGFLNPGESTLYTKRLYFVYDSKKDLTFFRITDKCRIVNEVQDFSEARQIFESGEE